MNRPPSGDTPNWFTPLPWFLDLERRLLEAKLIPGPFTLDPCGHREAPVTREILRRGGQAFTKDDDGLFRSWEGQTVFANPPYDAATLELWAPEFVRRAPGCLGLVIHVPNWSDRRWWAECLEPPRRRGEAVLWCERGRLRYGWPGNPEGIGGPTAKFPSAVLIWPAAPKLSQKGFEKTARATGRPRVGDGSAQAVAGRVAQLEAQLKARTRGHFHWTGEAVKQVAGEMGVSLATVYRRLAEAGRPARRGGR